MCACGVDSYVSGKGPASVYCEHTHEDQGFHKVRLLRYY